MLAILTYCLKVSASCLSRGASKAWFNGNDASPGIAKWSRAVFMSVCSIYQSELENSTKKEL